MSSYPHFKNTDLSLFLHPFCCGIQGFFIIRFVSTSVGRKQFRGLARRDTIYRVPTGSLLIKLHKIPKTHFIHIVATKRADATCNLIDALTGAVVVESPVATSESVLFEREFSSVADCLNKGAFDETALRLVRLRSNRVLYGRPEPKPAGSKGRKRKHEDKFKLKHPSRAAEQE